MTIQKYDPHAIKGELHCGDCNKPLILGTEEVAEYVRDFNGIHCMDCAKKSTQVEGRNMIDGGSDLI